MPPPKPFASWASVLSPQQTAPPPPPNEAQVWLALAEELMAATTIGWGSGAWMPAVAVTATAFVLAVVVAFPSWPS